MLAYCISRFIHERKGQCLIFTGPDLLPQGKRIRKTGKDTMMVDFK